MYYFNDYDDNIGDMQIGGSDYAALIKLCCLYSEYGSMTFTSQEQVNRFSKDLCLERIELLGDEKGQRTHRGFLSVPQRRSDFCSHMSTNFFSGLTLAGTAILKI